MPSVRKLFGDGAVKPQADEAKFAPPARETCEAATQPAAAKPAGEAPAAAPGAARGPAAASSGETIEVVARHAIQGTEVKVLLPARAKFRHVKKALAELLGSDEILARGQLMKKDAGIYNAFKDAKKVGDVRLVLVVCADFSSLPEGENLSCSLDEGAVSEDEEEAKQLALAAKAGAAGDAKAPFNRQRAVALQKELLQGFADDNFQKDLRALEKRRNGGTIAPSDFMAERQELFLRVQKEVLPSYGFPGTSAGVYKMMGSMGPFVKDPEFIELGEKINELIGVTSASSSWGDLAKSCKKLENTPESNIPAAKAKAKSQQRTGGARFGLGFGGMNAFSSPMSRPFLPPPEAEAGAAKPQAAESNAPAFEPWDASRPPPFRLFVAGTFNEFSPTEMDWDADGGLFVCPIQVGEAGCETFQLLVNGTWEKTVYPSVFDAGPFEAHEVKGPDNQGHGKNWRMGSHRDEEVGPGKNFAIVAALDKFGKVKMVDWQPF